MGNDRKNKIVSIGTPFAKKAKATTQPFIKLVEQRIQQIVIYRDHILNGNKTPAIETSKMAIERGAALIQPFAFPIPEDYAGQHEENLTRMNRRIDMVEQYLAPHARTERVEQYDITNDDEDDHDNQHQIVIASIPDDQAPLDPAIYTLATMGGEYCDATRAQNGCIETRHTIQKHLNGDERRYISDIFYADQTGKINDEERYSDLLLVHIYDDLLDIKDRMLKGTLSLEDVDTEKTLKMVNAFMAYSDGVPIKGEITVPICETLRDIDVLKNIKPYDKSKFKKITLLHHIMQQDWFTENSQSLAPRLLGQIKIETNNDHIKIIEAALHELSTMHIDKKYAPFEEYMMTTILPLETLLEHFPDTNPEFVSQALLSVFFTLAPDTEKYYYYQQAGERILDTLKDNVSSNTLNIIQRPLITPETYDEASYFIICQDLISLQKNMLSAKLGSNNNHTTIDALKDTGHNDTRLSLQHIDHQALHKEIKKAREQYMFLKCNTKFNTLNEEEKEQRAKNIQKQTEAPTLYIVKPPKKTPT